MNVDEIQEAFEIFQAETSKDTLKPLEIDGKYYYVVLIPNSDGELVEYRRETNKEGTL